MTRKKLTTRPNVHGLLHLADTARRYATLLNVNCSTGEAKHRPFKIKASLSNFRGGRPSFTPYNLRKLKGSHHNYWLRLIYDVLACRLRIQQPPRYRLFAKLCLGTPQIRIRATPTNKVTKVNTIGIECI